MDMIQILINPWQFSEGVLPSITCWGTLRNLHILCTSCSGKKGYELFHENLVCSAYIQTFASLTVQETTIGPINMSVMVCVSNDPHRLICLDRIFWLTVLLGRLWDFCEVWALTFHLLGDMVSCLPLLMTRNFWNSSCFCFLLPCKNSAITDKGATCLSSLRLWGFECRSSHIYYKRFIHWPISPALNNSNNNKT